MEKLNLDTLEETLFVPMRGRVFCSRTFPDTFKDEKALEIAKDLPEEYMNLERETEYTLMASAIRSKNMDIYIKKFLSKNPNGTIINIGCGMETTFYRNDNGKCIFIEMDLEEVTSMREKVFGKNKRDIILTKSLLDYSWIEDVKKIAKGPYLIIASGVFYYFPKDQIIEFLRKVKLLGTVEILFDTVSKSGMKRTKKYMKQLGKEDATMYFYVEKGKELINEIGNNCKLIDEHDFYDFTENKSKFKFKTKLYMVISDKLHMVKMIQLKYGDE